MAEDIIIVAVESGALCAVLSVGGLIADYILPRIPFVERFLDTLPEWDDEEPEA